MELRVADTRNRGGNGFLEALCKMKRQAAIAHGMLMPAFETRTFIAEQQRARREQCFTLVVAITKVSRSHDRDTGRRVLFLEWAILWTRGAHEIIDLPARSGREKL